MSTRARLFWTAMAIFAYWAAMMGILGLSDADTKLGLSAIAAQLFAAAMLAAWVPGSSSTPSRSDVA